MKIKQITSFLESIAPLSLQEDYDNSGLIVGNPEAETQSAVICLDCTEAVVDEAVQKKCALIIVHHPIVFRGVKKITGRSYVERVLLKAIRNGIAIYAIHTNLDNVMQGVNKKICEKLSLNNLKFLSPSPLGETKAGIKAGAGMIGTLSKPMAETPFLRLVKRSMKAPLLRHTALLGKKVSRVAVCGGSGSFLLPDALRAGADVFMTSDFKYHQFFDAENQIVIADIGHYEGEQFTGELIRDLLKGKFPTFATHLTKINTNPVNYL